MPQLAANLTMLFNEEEFLDRFAAAAQAGFRGVEFLFPYAFQADQIADKLNQHQLDLVLHNLPAGDWAGGERGIACHPGRENEFQ
ncbi:MAG TPA: hydroxypyruvate isomerase, partial [Burkholderiaceae bacterium]|nr:hydroxypyruvate isomerase [Burkholderiaceae bacterium]